ncbi:hypothetical protein BKA66DRAFT_570359 [Pyrenochaeta sp. MPI-SDFR-AT-0127]|nr:hypothetical protein BKA66DRAFT_570359 [Pyrenochaeta sp. MPI-SDFR-AT-0127]
MEHNHSGNPYNTHQLLDQDVDTLLGRQSPGIDELVHRFLENIKLRFGAQSFEVNTINGILSSFQNAEMSKRDAISSITFTLRSYEDLKQDLMNVLHHKDASWGVEDFDFDQPIMQPSPKFLQPAHKPHMRMPPVSTLYSTNTQNIQSIDPAVLNESSVIDGYSRHLQHEPVRSQHDQNSWPAFAELPSSPTAHLPARFEFSNQFASSVPEYPARFSHYTHAPYNANSPLHHGFESTLPQSQLQEPWKKVTYSNYWAVAGPDTLPRHKQSLVDDRFQPPAPWYDVHSHQMVSPKRFAVADLGPSVLGDAFAVPIGEPSIDMLPSLPRTPHHKGSVARVGEQSDRGTIDSDSLPPTSDTLRSEGKQMTLRAGSTPSEGRLFIHSICGKAFASRAKVKKHHWGAKNGDLQTKTGCWAKHKKLSVSWDDHPSCRQDMPAPRIVKRTPTRPMRILKEPDHQILVGSAMSSSQGFIPGFPTLHTLPQAVANALTPSQHAFQEIGSYHSYRLPPRGDFDSLLTAVNVASRIEAPKPQGLNDSVLSHLDAQAVVAERSQQRPSPRISSPCESEEDGSSYDRTLVTIKGPGISDSNADMHAPTCTVSPSQADEEDCNSSSPFTDAIPGNDHSLDPPKRE